MQRRSFLKISASTTLMGLLPGFSRLSAEPADPKSPPRFFLMIVLEGGADPTYMFDARPLSMTAAGKVQNYLGQAPRLLTDRKGRTTWASPLMDPLMEFKDTFSILNGVMMTPSFDGHLQNMNFLFTGNSFGGESFIPDLNQKNAGRPRMALDAVVPSRNVFINSTNHSAVVPLAPSAVNGLSKSLQEVAPPTAGDDLSDFIRSRYSALSGNRGRFEKASRLMESGIMQTPDLHRRMALLTPPAPNLTPIEQEVQLIAEAFGRGISRSAILKLSEEFDVHAPDQAKAQPTIFANVGQKLATILRLLRTTPFDSQQSLLDVTTFLVTSEMGRTLRINGIPVDNTGTNHNQFGNSMLLGGCGIRGGLIVGASDLESETAVASPAHLSLDSTAEKVFGRPFDFASGLVRTDLPSTFQVQDYLTVNSVVNTIYSSMGVPAKLHRLIGRDLPVAPVLNELCV